MIDLAHLCIHFLLSSASKDLSVIELAKLYGMTRQSIYKRIQKGDLSKNSNGKIDRTVLKIPNNNTLKNNIIINQEYVTKITKMVENVLNLNNIEPDIDLLSMGANSIDIVKLANLLEQEFGFCPKMGDIFQLKTINKLAQRKKNDKQD